MKIIRRLNLGEGSLYRSVRLESLRDSPGAFDSSYEDALARSEDSWNNQADSSATGSDRATFVFMDGKPHGLAAIYRDEYEGELGELIQMWVSPKHRGGPAAKNLLDEIFAWAAVNSFTHIKAEVKLDNVRAMRFYQKYGFVSLKGSTPHGNSGLLLTKKVESTIGCEG